MLFVASTQWNVNIVLIQGLYFFFNMGKKKIHFTVIHRIVWEIKKKKVQRIPESSKWDDDKIVTKKSDMLLWEISTQMSLLK